MAGFELHEEKDIGYLIAGASSGALVQLGDHVVIKGEKTGRIRYIGHLDRIGEPNLVFVGLELDAPGERRNSFLEPKLDNTWPSSSTDAVLASLGVRGLTNVQGKTRSVDNLKSKSTEDFIALVGMTSRPHGKSNWLKSEMLTRRDDPLCRMTASAFGEDSV
ncbi:cell polarity protein alp11 [Plakobranchus ocellatus]|uniref:Cell polarity protein alp11 n=1 Tax=Plakobranchus ocellatus TaxID=259542 RepID=A0AAV4CHU0_9GAST|nr:cell polarity protein alp11 [Plakobranchus ocellatus]